MTVVSLVGTQLTDDGANADVIRELEDLLRQARRGEIKGFAIAAGRPNGHVHTGWAGIGALTVLGGVQVLATRLASACWHDT
ncbi:hypothetical protein DRW48_10425 [Paracoccus suum]|uniref:Uncharacterized protein n=1 Tax=Paracoccus suum TaxID=2259340 RepID=A0A344PKZ4_9RHOB|nr:hypothetical protein [Paracoccus suum]AXC50049.1 hypothetical protein DRW48_10425 [Paracoccus suum]